MNNIFAVQIVQPQGKTADYELGFVLRKTMFFRHVSPQVPAWQIVHCQVQVLSVLEGLDHIYDKGISE